MSVVKVRLLRSHPLLHNNGKPAKQGDVVTVPADLARSLVKRGIADTA